MKSERGYCSDNASGLYTHVSGLNASNFTGQCDKFSLFPALSPIEFSLKTQEKVKSASLSAHHTRYTE
jgi:hypothetical protein